MANERSSPWVDWTEIDFPSVLWITSAASWPFTAAPLAAANVETDAIDSAADPSVQGGATNKPRFSTGGSPLNAGYMHQIAIPDSVVNKQRERVAWDGVAGTPMDDSASDRIALEVDNFILIASSPATMLFKLSAKFRGYGAPVGGAQTEDVYVGPAGFGQAVSVFPRMSVALAPILISPGFFMARIRHLIEVPNTVGPGDVVELVTLFQMPFVDEFGRNVRFQTARYRWVKPPYEVDPNTGLQLTGTEAQPRTDESTFLP